MASAPQASAALPQGYVQNAASTVAYRDAIDSGQLATARGRFLTDEDRLRREIIERLMCDLEVYLAEVTAARARSVDDFSAESWLISTRLPSTGCFIAPARPSRFLSMRGVMTATAGRRLTLVNYARAAASYYLIWILKGGGNVKYAPQGHADVD